MKKRCKIKYSKSEQMIEISGYGIQDHVVVLRYPGAAGDTTKNIDGFVLYDVDGNILKDCSEYKYRYDVLEDDKDVIYYTDLVDMVQTEKWHHSDAPMEEEPLTNEELTACVAELMYETSLMQLGMEG